MSDRVALAPLADLCSQERSIILPGSEGASRFRYVGMEHVESETGIIAFHVPSESPIIGQCFHFDSRHVLYGKLRPYLNKVAVPDFEGRCSTELIPLVPAKGVDRKYLAYTLRHPATVMAAMGEKTGSRMPRADMNGLLGHKVPLPPLARQREIVARLDAQLAAAARARAAVAAQLADAEKLEDAFIAEVFSTDDIAGVQTHALSDLCEIGTGTTPSRSVAAYFGHDHPWFTPGDLGREIYVTRSREGLSELGVTEGRGHLFPARTVLLVCIGATIGKVSIADIPAAANQQVNGLECGPELWPEYLLLWLKTQRARLFEDGGSVTLPIVNQKGLGRYEIPLPPLDVQKCVAANVLGQLVSTRSLIATLTTRLAELDRLPAALLRAAFTF